MDQGSIRLYTLNALTIFLSFTNIESVLKVLLLCISIVYTTMKIIDWVQIKLKNRNVNNDKEIIQD